STQLLPPLELICKLNAAWRVGLTDHSEYEKYCIVAQNHLTHLFEYFRIQAKNKTELLVGNHNGFNGRNVFATYIKLLDENHIPYRLIRAGKIHCIFCRDRKIRIQK